MGVQVYGHWGPPVLVFPTSAGDEHEYEGQGMIRGLAHHIEAGRVKFYCVDSTNNDSWLDDSAHPRHQSWIQAMYDAYIVNEVVPFIRNDCQSPDLRITTTGSSFGAYHAANTLFKHPDAFERCLALSGVYDLSRYADGDTDENFYFNNPAHYMANLNDERTIADLRNCDIRLATGHGPWEDSEPTYQMSEILHARSIPHSVDDWGAMGGHDWPYWKYQMDQYIQRLF